MSGIFNFIIMQKYLLIAVLLFCSISINHFKPHQMKLSSWLKSLFFLQLFLSQIAFGQAPVPLQPKHIQVIGSAEKMIVPDQIELQIVLTEYDKDGSVVKLSSIQKEFYATLKKMKIDTSKVKSEGLQSMQWTTQFLDKSKTYKTRTYTFTVGPHDEFFKLIDQLDQKWVDNISVIRKDNKDIEQYRREVKVAAIQAAKQKASYLLAAVGEQVGGVWSVEEIPDNDNSWTTNLLSNIIKPKATGGDDVGDVEAIKIRYEIKVIFEIR
jgi:uncharacterized protein